MGGLSMPTGLHGTNWSSAATRYDLQGDRLSKIVVERLSWFVMSQNGFDASGAVITGTGHAHCRRWASNMAPARRYSIETSRGWSAQGCASGGAAPTGGERLLAIVREAGFPAALVGGSAHLVLGRELINGLGPER